MLCPSCHQTMQVSFFCDTTEYRETTILCLNCGYSETEKVDKKNKFEVPITQQ